MPESTMPSCTECGRPATWGSMDGRVRLCEEHAKQHNETLTDALRSTAAMVNFYEREVAASLPGLYTPNYIDIPAAPRRQEVTVNHITITGGTVGVVNTGVVEKINVEISTIESSGNRELAIAAKEFGQAVVDSGDLDADAKRDITEQLEYLLAQVQTPPQERNRGLIRSAIGGIGRLVERAAQLATVWIALSPLILTAVGL